LNLTDLNLKGILSVYWLDGIGGMIRQPSIKGLPVRIAGLEVA
jgi:hypothetical protein